MPELPEPRTICMTYGYRIVRADVAACGQTKPIGMAAGPFARVECAFI